MSKELISPPRVRIQTKSIIDTLDEYEYVWAPILFIAAAFFTRLYKIGLSNIVTWDEAQ